MSEAQVIAMMTEGVEVQEFIRTNGGTAGTNLLGLIADYVSEVGTLQGQYAANSLAGMNAVRANFAGSVSSQSSWIAAGLLEYAKAVNCPFTDPQLILRWLYQYYIDNSKRVASRAISFGSVSLGGSNVGNGTIYRLTTDANSLAIENTFAQLISLICIRDRNSGAQVQQEVFQISGGEANKDLILVTGSGNVGTVSAISAANSLAYIQTPSFDTLNGTGTDKFPGWTIAGSASNYSQDATVYRTYYGAPSTPYSLKQTASDTIAQAFTVNNSQFDPNVPMYLHVAVNGSAGTASGGTLTLTFGDQTVSATIASLSPGWNLIQLGLSAKNWYQIFMGTAPTLSLAWASASSGYVLWDDVTLAPFQNFDGLWYAPVGGTTPFIVNDTATFTDTEAGTTGLINYHFWQAYGLTLPATTHITNQTWPDP